MLILVVLFTFCQVYQCIKINTNKMPCEVTVKRVPYSYGTQYIDTLLVRHFGYSWSPGTTWNCNGTRSGRRLLQKESQIDLCTAL